MASPRVAIVEALDDMASGRMVVVVDDFQPDNEGQLVMAAQFATADHINFMTIHGRGLIGLALSPERCDGLALDVRFGEDGDERSTKPMTSVDAREVLTEGVSSSARARTVQRVLRPDTRPGDLVQPGHVFPLKASAGGVLERAGRTEAAVDLARLAGLIPAGVVCEILTDDGATARLPDLEGYCLQHNLRMITLGDLIAHRSRHDRLIEPAVEARLPTRFADFQVVGYRSSLDGNHHIALVKGEVTGQADVLVRVHSECFAGDVFGSLVCDCGRQLAAALARIEHEGRGVLVYVTRERGGRLVHNSSDASDASECFRDHGVGAQILVDLGLLSVRLLTSHARSLADVERFAVAVTERIPLELGG